MPLVLIENLPSKFVWTFENTSRAEIIYSIKNLKDGKCNCKNTSKCILLLAPRCAVGERNPAHFKVILL